MQLLKLLTKEREESAYSQIVADLFLEQSMLAFAHQHNPQMIKRSMQVSLGRGHSNSLTGRRISAKGKPCL